MPVASYKLQVASAMWADEKEEVASHICGEMLRSQRGEHKHKNQNEMQLMHRGMRRDAGVDDPTRRSQRSWSCSLCSKVGSALLASLLSCSTKAEAEAAAAASLVSWSSVVVRCGRHFVSSLGAGLYVCVFAVESCARILNYSFVFNVCLRY